MSGSGGKGGVEYALVDFDAHERTLYPTIYKHLRPLSLKFTESVVMVNLAQVNKAHAAFDAINKEASKKGIPPITFNITDAHPRMAGELRERSVKALNEQSREIGKRLLAKIESLEKKFNAKTDDVNHHLYKKRLVVAAAERELEQARGLSLMFMIEKDITTAVEASEKVVKAQRAEWKEARDKKKAEVRKLKEAALKKEGKAPKAKAPKKAKKSAEPKPEVKPEAQPEPEKSETKTA